MLNLLKVEENFIAIMLVHYSRFLGLNTVTDVEFCKSFYLQAISSLGIKGIKKCIKKPYDKWYEDSKDRTFTQY